MCSTDLIPFLLDIMRLSGDVTVKVRPGPIQMLSAAEKARVHGACAGCGNKYNSAAACDLMIY